MISVIVVQHNNVALTLEAIRTIEEFHRAEHEIILVDNGSTDGSLARLKAVPGRITLIDNGANAGFGSANNRGAALAKGEILLFLNNDTVTREEFLGKLESYFALHPSCGAAGPALLNPDGSLQYSTGKFPTVWTEWGMRRRREMYDPGGPPDRDWVTGAALAVRRSVFEEIGGFDERFFMYFEDVDLCRRIYRAGHTVHYLPSIRIVHLGGGSQKGGISSAVQVEYRRGQLLYYALYQSVLDNVLLKGYLGLKFLIRLLTGSHEQRAIALNVLSMLFRTGNAHRD